MIRPPLPAPPLSTLMSRGWRPVEPPRRPVLFVNPRSGDGSATRNGVVERARERGVEAVTFGSGDDLKDTCPGGRCRWRLHPEIDGRESGSDRERRLDRRSAPIPAAPHGKCCCDAQPQDRVVSRPREPAKVSVQLWRGGHRHSLVHGPVQRPELLQGFASTGPAPSRAATVLCEGVLDCLLRFADAPRQRRIVTSRTLHGRVRFECHSGPARGTLRVRPP